MHARVWLAGLVLVQVSVIGLSAWQGGSKTVWDGVYTKDQAAKGEAVYNEKCVNCHGIAGAGNDAPPLNDSGFASDWDTLPLDELFKRIKDTMPVTAVGSLSRSESAELVAYLLQVNRFPDGATPLSEQNGALVDIKYVAQQPAK